MRICVGGLGLSVVLVALGYVAPVEAQNGGEPEAHPMLTENEYRIVAEQGQKSAAARAERKRARLAQLTARREAARAAGDSALEAQLGAVAARLEAGSPPLDEQERWARKHGRRMTLRGLWTNYGKQLHQPAVMAEFDAHAWRAARLERAHRVAESVEDAARRQQIVTEVEALVAAESERHRAALKRLLQPAGAPASAGSAAPGAASSAASSGGGPNP